MKITITEAITVAAILREKAAQEQHEAASLMHNAAISRIESAKELNALATRYEEFADNEQHLENERQSAGPRKFIAARRRAVI